VNNTACASIEGGEGINVGIRVDFGVKMNHEFYLVEKPRPVELPGGGASEALVTSDVLEQGQEDGT